ncbi:MAG TPA: VOC family protein [Candidatus Binatia bacterium]|nr:VOC family protein [Candidatus Binatia bacterium]
MAQGSQARPPVAIGHVSLRIRDIPQATQYFVTLGLRLIHQAQSLAVLEVRGGTHLVLRPTTEPIAPGTKAPFDLMVDDLSGARREYEAAGLKPSEIETGMVHRWFTLVGPDGYELTVTSSHTAGRVV